jgi:dethiobiotin synthetase
VVLVVGVRLGCISQAMLTVEAIQARGLTLIGWVANTVDADMGHAQANIQALVQRINAPLLGQLPRFEKPTAALAASLIEP